MIPSFILALREGLEIALIIGIVLGALYKVNRRELSKPVWLGAVAAILLSFLVAGVLNYFDTELKGRAEQIFEGVTMLIAAGVLTWMILWMNKQAKYLKSDLEDNVQKTILVSGFWGLFSITFIAVVREGIELSLFFTAALAATQMRQAAIGAVLGLIVAGVLGWIFFSTTLRLDLRRFFLITSVLLVFFAAGLVAQGVHELNEAGIIPALIDPVWRTTTFIQDDSTHGSILKTLFGYTSTPSLSTIMAYVAYFVLLFIVLPWRFYTPKKHVLT
jgi:high-affinity iron transporter